MRLLLTTLLLLTITSACFAQKQETYFLKNGSVVSSIDNADYTRTVTLPDKKRNTYLVADYYKNGKRKLEGTAISVNPLIFDGEVISYFESGAKKAVNKYNRGSLIGEQQEFFPNGKLYVVENHVSLQQKPFPTNIFIISNYDSLGNALVTNGEGTFKRYDADFKLIAEAGNIKGGQRDGEWKGVQGDLSFLDVYDNGKLISGKATNKNGEINTYTEVETLPSFPGGQIEFLKYLAKSVRYPPFEGMSKVNGKVVVSFAVEKDGAITDIKVVRSVSKAIDAAAVKAIKQMPNWIPATKRGMIVKSNFIVPINFESMGMLN